MYAARRRNYHLHDTVAALSQKKLLVQRRVLAQLNTQTTSPLDCSTGSSSQPTSPPRPSMAAVAEEPGPIEGGGTPAAQYGRRPAHCFFDQMYILSARQIAHGVVFGSCYGDCYRLRGP